MSLPDGELGIVPEGGDPEEYDRRRRRALWSMPTGLFIVGSRSGEVRNLMTANLVMQIATTPKLVAVAVEVASKTRSLIEASGRFSVSVLARSDRAIVRRFVRPTDTMVLAPEGTAVTMQGVEVSETPDGVPYIASARWWLSFELRRLLRWDDGEVPSSHVLVVGEVADVGGEGTGEQVELLRMEDTRMHYGG
ncbi:MAG: flavin reductase family protein [Acidimicrobiales bacterium]